MPSGLQLALAAALALGPRDGPRDPPLLAWDAPLECPDASWVEARVAAYLGHGARLDGATIRAHVHAEAAGFVLMLDTEVAGHHHHHRLRHHDCAAVGELAASLAAIAIDPLAAGAGPISPAGPPGRTAPTRPTPTTKPRRVASEVPIQRPRARPIERAPSSTAKRERPDEPSARAGQGADSAAADQPHPAVRDPPRPAPRQAPTELGLGLAPIDPTPLVDTPPESDDPGRLQLALSASGGVALGLFPNLAPTVHAGLGLAYRPDARDGRGPARVGVELDLRGGASLAGRFRDASGSVGGDMLAWDLGLRTCALPRWRAFELRACASFGGGQVRATGVGVEASRVRAHPWLFMAPELGGAVVLAERVALFADLGLSLNLLRPNFAVSSPDSSYATPIASGQVRAGVRVAVF